MKSMIFHYPAPIVENGNVASQIRPYKMLKAFENSGYKVFQITGYGSERRKKYHLLKKKIKDGYVFDFLYSESLTIPTALAEPNHIPTFPFLDAKIFLRCNKADIKVGLFYRDIYWKFDEIYNSPNYLHKIVSKFFHYYDLILYRYQVDFLFLPSIEMADYIPLIDSVKCIELPAGHDFNTCINSNDTDSNKLNLLYVGGFGPGYPMQKLFNTLELLPNVEMTLCTRKSDWLANRQNVKIPANVEVVHKSGEELASLYEDSDVVSLVLEPQRWRKFAFPFKFFEYLGNGKPIIAIIDSPPGRLVEQLGIGWAINYTEEDISKLLNSIMDCPSLLKKAKSNIALNRPNHTWKARADSVISRLT
ncbi:glycosyltransferase family protein [Paraglaciecola chathamensis]|uniref:Glycosyl transferase family 1 domain-containing protein n=1 Tax=Paraglaciecola chathamensis S18K6 TaxID=1127672 RepID=A0AAV3V113_9ALTE|nr:hypothetical protein [Paraglaciecola chathamensis]GAC10542.1 hypothetical protein GCHA_2595 [Paraglaciecola chathamensis S18K6]